MTPSMTLGPETLSKRLIDHASEPNQAAGRFAYHSARGSTKGGRALSPVGSSR
jgi:hypothetical protein